MLNPVFDQFAKKSPISVMARGMMERVLNPQQLDEWFAKTADQQYTRDLLFSTVFDLTSLVISGSHRSIHAAKANQSKYPWAQNVVLVGLLKRIKGRWACLPLAHRFYLPKKAIEAKLDNMKIPGEDSSFQTKLDQAVKMLTQLAHHFVGVPLSSLTIRFPVSARPKTQCPLSGSELSAAVLPTS